MSAFEELGVCPELIRAVEDMGWLLPSPIQQESIPLILTGGDVLAAAETGSGKTGAFALPVLQLIHEALTGKAQTNRAKGAHPSTDVLEMSKVDRDPLLAIASDGVVVQSRAERSWCGGRATAGVREGRCYFECKVRDEGLCRIGWAMTSSSLEIGTDALSFGYGGTGKKSHKRQFDDYGEVFGLNDVIGCALDWEEMTISFYKNRKSLGKAFDVPSSMRGNALYPAISLKNAELGLDFSPSFVPPGFVAVSKASLVYSSAADLGESNRDTKQRSASPLCLILEPTRELAEQVEEEVRKFVKYLPHPRISHALCVGGTNIKALLEQLRKGVDLIVATPGRLIDLVESGKITLTQTKYFILDEADRLLDTGNAETVLKVHQRIMKHQRPQVLLFSATLHTEEIKRLHDAITVHATWVDLKGRDAVPDTVHHCVVRIDPLRPPSLSASTDTAPPKTDGVHKTDTTAGNVHTPEALSETIKCLKPPLVRALLDKYDMEQCIIFCRTKVDCDNLEDYLVEAGGGKKFRGKVEKGKEGLYSCAVLHGDRPPHERRGNLSAFRDGDVRCLICTDVAARGIDIKGLPYMINVTLPDKPEDYIHRSGRVGRQDHMGMAISLVSTVKEKVWYHVFPKGHPEYYNRNVVDQGGCCIWYNEPEFIENIRKKISPMTLHVLTSSLDPPKDLNKVTYGEERDGGSLKETREHVERLKPAVRALADLETRAQGSFFALHERFAKRRAMDLSSN